MRKTLYSLIENAQDVLDLEPEELALPLITVLKDPENETWLNTHNIGLFDVVAQYPRPYQNQILASIRQAWNWLEHGGFIAVKPMTNAWYSITERGKQLTDEETLAAYRNAQLLPKSLLHPKIAQYGQPSCVAITTQQFSKRSKKLKSGCVTLADSRLIK
ncbi:MAG TPA: hypothetical protein VJ183_05155 [Chloroflexia bacterium]|nr:hypothetical protein [Chloroflexia bacterium]